MKIDKWFVARWFQFFTYMSMLIAGISASFSFGPVTDLLAHVPTDIYIPVASEWIGRTTRFYRELSGLDCLLAYCWYVIVINAIVTIGVALPALLSHSYTMGNEDSRIVVHRDLHQQLYSPWFGFGLSFLPKGMNKATLRSVSSKQMGKSSRLLAELVWENVKRAPATLHVLVAMIAVIYFSVATEAGPIAIRHHMLFITGPAFLVGTGLAITESLLYVVSGIIVFFKTTKGE